MFAHSCPSMPIIWVQIRLFLVRKYTFSEIYRLWLIRFWSNFLEMFLVCKELIRNSLMTCSAILAHACPLFRLKLGLFWSESPQKIKFLQMLCYDISFYAYFETDIKNCLMCILEIFKNWKKYFQNCPFLTFLAFFHWKIRKIKFRYDISFGLFDFRNFWYGTTEW